MMISCQLIRKPLVIVVVCFTVVGLSVLAYKKWDVAFNNAQHLYYQFSNAPSDNSQSRIDTLEFKSSVFAGATKQIKLYVPKAYAAHESVSFPVLYLLHGYPGSNTDWLINANLKWELDKLINNGELPPLLVAFPDANGPIIRDGQYLDATKIKQPTEAFILEVVAKVDNAYRTIKQRTGRGIGGLSSGGYGAMNIGLHHNDTFAIILSHSGYFINNESITAKLLDRDAAVRQRNNPLEYVSGMTIDPQTFIYFDIGSHDNQEYIRQNQEMDRILTQKNIPHQFELTDGSHGWEIWRRNISLSLLFAGKNLEHPFPLEDQ